MELYARIGAVRYTKKFVNLVGTQLDAVDFDTELSKLEFMRASHDSVVALAK